MASRRQALLTGCAAALGLPLLFAATAGAVTIELKDIAPDRIERQRAFTLNPVPLPGAPDTSAIEARLTDKGLKAGAPVLIRIFKAESQLELWMEKAGAFVHFATYPICNWSGTLGPKLREGDKQTPEGFYTVTSRQLHRIGRWRHALNLGFPNAYDESLKRDGSYILVHGGCSSVGCFAMTDPVVLEIFKLTSAALRGGQYHVPVHVFPFRMTDANMSEHAGKDWTDFWTNLKEGFDSFERTHRPPRVSVCRGRYDIKDAASPQEAGPTLPLAVCGETAADIRASNEFAWLVPLPSPASAQTPTSPPLSAAEFLSAEPYPPVPERELPQPPASAGAAKPTATSDKAVEPKAPEPRQQPPETALPQPEPSPATLPISTPETMALASPIALDRDYELVPRLTSRAATSRGQVAGPTVMCNSARASCRRLAALLNKKLTASGKKPASKGVRTALKASKAR